MHADRFDITNKKLERGVKAIHAQKVRQPHYGPRQRAPTSAMFLVAGAGGAARSDYARVAGTRDSTAPQGISPRSRVCRNPAHVMPDCAWVVRRRNTGLCSLGANHPEDEIAEIGAIDVRRAAAQRDALARFRMQRLKTSFAIGQLANAVCKAL